MAWFTSNWFWILIFIAFIGMHVFGHGSHGGHGLRSRQRDKDGDKTTDAVSHAENGRSSGHRH